MPSKKSKKNLPPHLANAKPVKKQTTPAITALLEHAYDVGYEPNGLREFVYFDHKYKQGTLDNIAQWITAETNPDVAQQGLEALDGYVRFMGEFLSYTKNLPADQQVELLLNIKGWLKVRGFQAQKDLKDVLIEVAQNGVTNKVINACNNYMTLDERRDASDY